MDISSLYQAVKAKIAAIGGDAELFSDQHIFLTWKGMEGTIFLDPGGPIVIKISTAWKDVDTITVTAIDEVPDNVVELFKNFWPKRGVNFRS